MKLSIRISHDVESVLLKNGPDFWPKNSIFNFFDPLIVPEVKPEMSFSKTHLSFELSERVMGCCQILWKLCKMWHDSWMSILKRFHHWWHRLNRKWTGSWTRFCFWWASRAWWNTRWWVVTSGWRTDVFSRFFAIAIAISKKIWNWKTEIWFFWFAWWCINNFNVHLKIFFRNFMEFFIKNLVNLDQKIKFWVKIRARFES